MCRQGLAYNTRTACDDKAVLAEPAVAGITSGIMRRVLPASFAVLALLASAQPAPAEFWPQKPVRLVVPFAAGGTADVIGRILAQHLSDAFATQFVVENRPGAAGAIGTEAVAHAPADGYSLLLAGLVEMAIAPALTKAAYDPVKDFAPISNIGANPLVLVVHPSIPATTVGEFVDYARRQPHELDYVTMGPGTLSHLTMVLFLKRAGIDMIPVVYKNGVQAMADMTAGHMKIYFANLTSVLPHLTSGALRPLAVSSERRAVQIPNVPTLAESGYPGFKTLLWTGLMAPAGTPKDIVDRIAKEVARGVKEPKVAERLVGSGVEPLGNSPEEFAATIATDIAMWAGAVKLAGGPEK
jgi:tripartite-type tricarboxylate transporter receptor subunit TctC